jgi:hypothetical protein
MSNTIQCAAECKSIVAIVPTLVPIIRIIGEYLCSKCLSINKIANDSHKKCPFCLGHFCIECGRGCKCNWRYLDNAIKSANIIRTFVLRRLFSNQFCDFMRSIVYYRRYCDERISLRLLQECEMTSIDSGGFGYKCRKHICPCRLGRYTLKYYCFTCCIKVCDNCSYGCKCK